jgi:hypothetical protein
MLPFAFIVVTNNQIRWHITYPKPDGRVFNGIDHLNHTDHDDIDVLLNTVVNRLQSLHGMLELEFRRD